MEAERKRALGRTALTVAALGVVFGDIGTSPIYTIQTAFNPGDPHPIGTITVTIIVLLFAIQRLGTGSVGRMFGPIML